MTSHLINFILAVCIGWLIGCGMISEDCKKLGGFHFGNATYLCAVTE